MFNNNTTTLRIRNEGNLTSNGTHHHKNCKPIIAIELHKTFNSITDTAEFFGVCISHISDVLNGRLKTIGLYERDENGNKIRLICRCRLTYAAHMESTVDKLMECGREATDKLNKANERIETLKKYNAELNAELAEYRAWKAEQEVIRKAKEEHEIAITKAKEKVERRKNIEQRKQEEYQLAIARRQEAERELSELLKGDDNVA